MITQDTVRQLANHNHTSEHPNIVREYFQHMFLSELYKIPDAGHLLFKGGTALRIVYGSPRFSEDLDFSLFGVQEHKRINFIEEIFETVLASIERSGINVQFGRKFGPTKEGYHGSTTFNLYDFPPVNVEIDISGRNGRTMEGQIATIASDFVPTYNLYHLPQDDLVREKIFGALLNRMKERDFYDLYWLLRSNLVSQEQKNELAPHAKRIIDEAGERDFKPELSTFLPIDQQAVIRNFAETLKTELSRQLGL